MEEWYDKTLILLGGKGGVGKTTMASAIAITLASKGKKTLLVSTDPAHSLSDSFGQQFSGDITAVKGIDNLYALEVDADKTIAEYRDIMLKGSAEDELLSQFLGDSSISDLIPPGTDETIAFLKLLEFMDLKSGYDTIVFDTAPTGHTLRLLSLPEVMDSWIWKLLKLRRKMASTVGMFKNLFRNSPENLEEKTEKTLELLKERVEDALDYLSDPDTTIFIPVTIATMMALLETQRLINALDENEMPHGTIIVNQIIPSNQQCHFCAKTRANQMSIVKLIKETLSPPSLIEVLMESDEIKGIQKLKSLAAMYFGR
ncbi:MAG: ArsA family ATPase [Candidatus Hodarchaeales archaeon]